MRRAAIGAACLSCWTAVAFAVEDPVIRFDVSPTEATVGDRLTATLEIELPSDVRLEATPVGPELGPFTVLDGAWSAPEPSPDGRLWRWSGTLVAFETGELTLPPLTLRVLADGGGETAATTPERTIRIASVLDPAEAETAELADLKDPVSLRPDYGAAARAASLLVLLVGLAGLGLWLYRRYARGVSEPARAPALFERVDPYAWASEELRKLKQQELLERGEVDLYYEELGRIVKLYLSGRFRIELMERTTSEVTEPLRRGGASDDVTEGTLALLGEADEVKFAAGRPGIDRGQAAFAAAERIIESSRPVVPEPSPPQGAA